MWESDRTANNRVSDSANNSVKAATAEGPIPSAAAAIAVNSDSQKFLAVQPEH